jgi:hypothetical protein
MYYIYDRDNKVLMADDEFIKLLGFKKFDELISSSFIDSIEFDNGKFVITLEKKIIKADFLETKLYTKGGKETTLLRLTNVMELKKSASELRLNYEPIYLDVNIIAKEMGLSIEDYKLYLNSFINQSIVDYDKLLKGDDKAIKNLSTLALTLKIPEINLLLLKIKNLPKEERRFYIDEYYTKLTLLTLREVEEKPEDKSSKFPVVEPDVLTDNSSDDRLDSTFTEVISSLEKMEKSESNLDSKAKSSNKSLKDKDDDKLDLDFGDDFSDFENLLNDLEEPNSNKRDDELISLKDDTQSKSKVSKEITKVDSSKDNNKIDLDAIEPIPIKYNPKVAADELNLPVVLIEEFVEDFIEQAHHDIDHLLASYYQKDMDNIHELGHKLKGAASNLRINELSDVLEEIQFCTDYSKLKPLFIRYWGLFKSLEEYMLKSKKI